MDSVQSLIDVKEAKTKLSEMRIIEVVADYYNLTSSQLTGKIRTNQIATARHVAMFLIKDLMKDSSLASIGRTFGGKDHTTVINAISKVEKMLKTDVGMQMVIEELRKRLKK